MLRSLLGGLFLLALAPALSFSVQPGDPEPKDPPKKEPAKVVDDSPPDTTADDIKLLATVGVKADGAALLDYFKKRTFAEADPKEMAVLLAHLGSEDFDAREKAFIRLMGMGAGALVGLKEAEKSSDAEVSRRALELRLHIEAKAEPAVQAAAARLLTKVKPAGAADVLMAYIPFAADQQVTDDICKTLGAVAFSKGKVEPVLIKALEDKLAVKRGAAGEALARAKATDELPSVKKLLQDADPSVRLRVGLALVPYREKELVPVLIDVLAHLNPEQLWPVEEILVKLAGDKTPTISLGTNETARKACRDAWKAWYDKEGKTIDLTKIDAPQSLLGYTLVVQQNVNRIVGGIRRPAVGEVMELDRDKKPRWKFDVPTYPVDAQIVGPDKVLIAEYQGGRITERDFKGNLKWEKNVGGNPIGVQRLPNGNTFIVMQNRLLEIDREGKEVFSMNRPNHDIFRARKLRNGEVVFIINQGTFHRVDKDQKQLKTFQVGQIPVLFGSIDILPNGGVLVPDFQQNRVVEFDGEGKQVKTFNVQWPNSVQRLPNGHTLVASQNSRIVAEFNREGQQVWTHTMEGMPFNAKKR